MAHPSRNPVQTQAGLVSAVGVAGNAQNKYVETCSCSSARRTLSVKFCKLARLLKPLVVGSKLLCLEDFSHIPHLLDTRSDN